MKMKNNTLLHLCLSVAAFTASLLPVTPRAATGDLYVADTGSGTIFKFTPAGAKTAFASTLNAPTGLAFDNKGNLYVAQSGSGTIWRFPLDFGVGRVFFAGLNTPSGLAFDGDGNLFVADTFSNSIFKLTQAGDKTTFAAGLNGPSGLAFDRTGSLFVADSDSNTIFKFAPDGSKSTFVSGLNAPKDLAFDVEGNLYVTDAGSDQILKVAPDGSRSTFATQLFGGFGLAFDGGGNLFEVSFGFNTIFRFTPAGAKSTFASGLNTPTFAAFEPATQKVLNISTRGIVQTGDAVLIVGFILGGNSLTNNVVMIRAIGPSLTGLGVAGALQVPKLELYNASGTLLVSNNDWGDTQRAQIQGKGLAPTDERESAILVTLPAGNHTAIVRGQSNTTGVALVEIYNVQ